MAYGIKDKMDNGSKNKDLSEDEELAALRMAALATLKSRTVEKSRPAAVINHVSPITSIVPPSVTTPSYVPSHIPFIQTDRTSYSTYNNSYPWRKHSQPLRRRGERFSKASHRSNLIVISPVSLEDKTHSDEKVHPVLLPQQKWSHSANEDSMSPKSYRKTGPTRFNRHESDSDSSESDLDNSDNDSCSNETVLQDEPSEHFSRLSPEESNDANSESVPQQSRNLDRRLSFHSLESNIKQDAFEKNETTSVYNCLKTYSSYESTDNRSDVDYNKITSQNGPTSCTWVRNTENNYNSFKQYNSSLPVADDRFVNRRSDSTKSFDNGSTVLPSTRNGDYERTKDSVVKNFGNYDKSDSDRSAWHKAESQEKDMFSMSGGSYFSKEEKNRSDGDRRLPGYLEKSHSLSHNDLRLELEKKFELERRHELENRIKAVISLTGLKNPKLPHGKQDSKIHSQSHKRSSRERSRSPVRRNREHSRNRYSRHRGTSSRSSSSSSTSSSSSASSSSSSSSPTIRSVPSVIKPVQPKNLDFKPENHDSKSSGRKSQLQSSESDHSPSHAKRVKDSDDQHFTSSNVKPSLTSSENKSHVSDNTKRVPVHMRLGGFPRKRVIQMTKDVEAAFINSSSDDENDVNIKCKKQNIRIVTEMCENKVEEKNAKCYVQNERLEKRSDVSKERSRRLKTHR